MSDKLYGFSLMASRRPMETNIRFDTDRIIALVGAMLVALLCASVSPVFARDDQASDAANLFYESLDLHEQGKLLEAIKKLEKLQEIDPYNPNVVANLAQFYGEAGLYKDAVRYYQALIQLEPNNVHAEAGYALYQSIIYAEDGRHGEALRVLEGVVDKVPDNQSILWNLGLSAFEVGQHDKALKYWSALASLEPDNMHLQSKKIQAYQSLNDIQGRDQELDKIMTMYKNNVDPEYIEGATFCREQYNLGTWRIFVFQYFDPGKENQYFYRYSAVDESGLEKFWLSLGSYQATTEIARETGSISASERLYHLDYYDQEMHALHGMYTKKPTYDELRDMTREILRGLIQEKTGATRKDFE